MHKIRQNIPNAITCGNLLCGCLAIVKAFEGDLVWAAYLVGIAAVLDFFDGFAARMLRVTSPIGKDLDSLADMVTFGVVPGVMLLQMIQIAFSNITSKDDGLLPDEQLRSILNHNIEHWSFIPYIALLIPIFSAIRLAKFNNDTRQTDSFIGLPTPANAIFFGSFPLIIAQISDEIRASENPFKMLVDLSGNPILALIYNPWFLIGLTVLFSLLLISPLPLFSLKFKFFGWQGNRMRYTFLGLSVILLATLKFLGIPLVIVLYIILSLINNFVTKK